MKTHKLKKTFLLLLILLGTTNLMAQEIMIAAGAGYKKPVMEVTKSFEESSGIKVNAVFGNIQMVSSQAKQTGEISCIIGDKKFLAKVEKTLGTLRFSNYQTIGNGILVLACRKGIEISKPEDLLNDQVKSVFMPQDGKAIYGIAGTEALKSYDFTSKLGDKLTQVATVPQVVSYLLTGEADAGFINLTEAMANKDRLGGYLIIPDDKYTEIIIVAGVVEGFEGKAETKQFLDFLQTEKVKTTFKKYGLK